MYERSLPREHDRGKESLEHAPSLVMSSTIPTGGTLLNTEKRVARSRTRFQSLLREASEDKRNNQREVPWARGLGRNKYLAEIISRLTTV